MCAHNANFICCFDDKEDRGIGSDSDGWDVIVVVVILFLLFFLGSAKKRHCVVDLDDDDIFPCPTNSNCVNDVDFHCYFYYSNHKAMLPSM